MRSNFRENCSDKESRGELQIINGETDARIFWESDFRGNMFYQSVFLSRFVDYSIFLSINFTLKYYSYALFIESKMLQSRI